MIRTLKWSGTVIGGHEGHQHYAGAVPICVVKRDLLSRFTGQSTFLTSAMVTNSGW